MVASDNLNENSTTVVIKVRDVNDNPPMFDRPTYETQITEEDDRHVPKLILQVIAFSTYRYDLCTFDVWMKTLLLLLLLLFLIVLMLD